MTTTRADAVRRFTAAETDAPDAALAIADFIPAIG